MNLMQLKVTVINFGEIFSDDTKIDGNMVSFLCPSRALESEREIFSVMLSFPSVPSVGLQAADFIRP